MTMALKKWINALVGQFFPDVCQVCGQSLVEGEKVLCSHCNLKMQRTNFHLDDDNALQERLICHARIERAVSLFYYVREDPYSRLIHKFKYNKLRQIGFDLTRMYVKEIVSSHFFDGIDLLLPVPMHRWKELRRGYNQSEVIALGISRELNIPVGHNLVAKKSHSTQTKKGAYGRWLNAEGIYGVKKESELSGKHVLVIDDVITTGSTVIHCCEALAEAVPLIKISVLSLATTRLS